MEKTTLNDSVYGNCDQEFGENRVIKLTEYQSTVYKGLHRVGI